MSQSYFPKCEAKARLLFKAEGNLPVGGNE
jgi:hypothetical protein